MWVRVFKTNSERGDSRANPQEDGGGEKMKIKMKERWWMRSTIKNNME